LNRAAAEALAPFDIYAATDVTGFGLLGHARELALAGGVSLRIDSSELEWIDGALECARGGHLAGGLKANREFLGGCVEFAAGVALDVQNLLYDPQTSGGLLAAIAPDQAAAAQKALREAGCAALLAGEVLPKTSPLLAVR